MTAGVERHSSFDRIAGAYDRARPTYPDAVFERIIDFAELESGARLLEIGCGSGKATLPFARKGYEIVALEPGPDLAAIAQRSLTPFPKVTLRSSRFEAWPLDHDGFDLVFAAQSLHWVDPEQRLVRARRALRLHTHIVVQLSRVLLII